MTMTTGDGEFRAEDLFRRAKQEAECIDNISRAQLVDDMVLALCGPEEVPLLQQFAHMHASMARNIHYKPHWKYHRDMRDRICQRIVEIWNNDATISGANRSGVTPNLDRVQTNIEIAKLIRRMKAAKSAARRAAERGDIKEASKQAEIEFGLRKQLEDMGWTGIE